MRIKKSYKIYGCHYLPQKSFFLRKLRLKELRDKIKILIFLSKFGIPSKNEPSGIAGRKYVRLYGKSQFMKFDCQDSILESRSSAVAELERWASDGLVMSRRLANEH